MPPRRRKRLDPSVFALPVDQIRAGFYTETYLDRTRALLRRDKRSPSIVTQVSGLTSGYLSGIDEVVAMLRLCADDWSALAVHALCEGDWYDDWDTVLTIEGPYESFAHLETLYLGILSRRTRICTNVRAAVEAARPKPVFFCGMRDDLYLAQPGDGFSAQVAGAALVGTPAQAALFGGRTVRVIPHSVVAAYGGSIVRGARQFADAFPDDTEVIASVDYQNDCVKTSLDLARALEGRLWGVHLATSSFMVDKSVIPQMGPFLPTGGNSQLVWNVRNALDGEGFGEVKIVASGGFDAERIHEFEEENVPVDAYEVGAAMHHGAYRFSADVVQVDGKAQVKAGRELRPNAKLERVK